MSINTKKNIFSIITLVLTLLVFIVATTFAYFSVVASREKDSTKIYTGTVLINYHQGDIIKGVNIVPATNFKDTEPTIEVEQNVYKNNFSVSNSGTLPVVLTINIDIINNEFSNNILKYILFDSTGRKISKGSITKNGIQQILNNYYLKQNSTNNYTLMIWLEDNGENQNIEQGKSFSGKLVINAINKDGLNN